ncbi:MAG: hypothetical protein HKN07_04300 [Acidimicrobiia bacterium]|nr:hypothetical protein [Acidimicrobiia bacterium]
MFIPVTGRRIPRRIAQLVLGLILFGSGIGLVVQSQLGNPAWDVLHQGLAKRFDGSWSTIGNWTVIISFVVLLLWIPLRQRLGLGTVLNAILIGVTVDVLIRFVEPGESLAVQLVLLSLGVVLVGIGSGFYIGAHLGPGPRDGLMTGIAALGPPIWSARLVIELSVLVAGWILGGTVGIGTVVFAFAIGPLVQFFLRHLSLDIEPAAAALAD